MYEARQKASPQTDRAVLRAFREVWWDRGSKHAERGEFARSGLD
jgi:hypothetical protein